MKNKNFAPKSYEKLERKYYVEITPTLGRINVSANSYIIMHQLAKEHEKLKAEHLAEHPQDAFNPNLDNIVARKLTLAVKQSQYNREKHINGELYYNVNAGIEEPKVKKKSHRFLKFILILAIIGLLAYLFIEFAPPFINEIF